MIRSLVIGEERTVRVTVTEAEGGNENNKAVVSGMGCLFEAIKSFVKTTYIIRKVGVNVSERLFHVNFIDKITMKKGNFNTKLIDGPVFRSVNAENGTNSVDFHNRS